MNRLPQQNDGYVEHNIGPEATRFFKRVSVIQSLINVPFSPNLIGNAKQFNQQCKVICKKTGVHMDVARIGLLLIRAYGEMKVVDELQLPWLN